MEYEPNGFLRIRGCAQIGLQFSYPVLFLVGSKAFIKQKALKGILEYIVIKKSFYRRENPFQSRSLSIGKTFYQVSYLDTLNRFWVEDELIFESDAVDLAELFWDRIRYESEYIGNQTCFPN